MFKVIMAVDDKKITVALPGEWALQKVLGPILDELGSDFKKLYATGRDKIISKAIKKIPNLEDEGKVNLRVARDVFWNGSFTDESICAEYFAGILASSRSKDGKDDQGIYYLDIIKSLSSQQLHLHYVIYNSFNKLIISNSSKQSLNPGMGSEVQQEAIWFSSMELLQLDLKLDTDLEALFRKGLIYDYKTDEMPYDDKGRVLQYTMVRPTTLGIHIYAVAFNKIELWRDYTKIDFGNFESINLAQFYSLTQTDLKNVIQKNHE